MSTPVTLNKKYYETNIYTNVINTSFTEIIPADSQTLPTGNDELAIEEFFNEYKRLFFSIPTGGNNSHTTLIIDSSNYIGYSPQNDVIEALQAEISSLRSENLELQQNLQDITSQSVNQTNELLKQVSTNQ